MKARRGSNAGDEDDASDERPPVSPPENAAASATMPRTDDRPPENLASDAPPPPPVDRRGAGSSSSRIPGGEGSDRSVAAAAVDASESDPGERFAHFENRGQTAGATPAATPPVGLYQFDEDDTGPEPMMMTMMMEASAFEAGENSDGEKNHWSSTPNNGLTQLHDDVGPPHPSAVEDSVRERDGTDHRKRSASTNRAHVADGSGLASIDDLTSAPPVPFFGSEAFEDGAVDGAKETKAATAAPEVAAPPMRERAAAVAAADLAEGGAPARTSAEGGSSVATPEPAPSAEPFGTGATRHPRFGPDRGGNLPANEGADRGGPPSAYAGVDRDSTGPDVVVVAPSGEEPQRVRDSLLSIPEATPVVDEEHVAVVFATPLEPPGPPPPPADRRRNVKLAVAAFCGPFCAVMILLAIVVSRPRPEDVDGEVVTTKAVSASPNSAPSRTPSSSSAPSSSPTTCADKMASEARQIDLQLPDPSGPRIAVDGGNMVAVSIDLGSSAVRVAFFALQNGGWELVEMIPEDYPRGEYTVAISGNTAMVGLPNARDDAGAVFVYEEKSSGGWEKVEQQLILSSSSELWGRTLSLDGNLACVGSLDSVSILHRPQDGHLPRGTWLLLNSFDIESPSECIVAGKTIAVQNKVDGLVILKYDEDLFDTFQGSSAEPVNFTALSPPGNAPSSESPTEWPTMFPTTAQTSTSATQVPTSSPTNPFHLIASNVTSATLSENYFVLVTNNAAVNIYRQGNDPESFELIKQMNYSDAAASHVAMDRDILVIGGDTHTFIYSEQNSTWKESMVLDRSYDHYQVLGRMLLVTREDHVYSLDLEYCIQSTTSQVPTSSLEPTAAPCFGIGITVLYDDYPSETSWQLHGIDEVRDDIVLAYHAGKQDDLGIARTAFMCLPAGEYIFTIFDSYGDGLQLGNYYNISSSNGGLIAVGGDFDDRETSVFSLPFSPASSLAPISSSLPLPTSFSPSGLLSSLSPPSSISPSMAPLEGLFDSDCAGCHPKVAICGDTVVVARSGIDVQFFSTTNQTLELITTINITYDPSDVAITDGTAVIGSSEENALPRDAAYVYERNQNGMWNQTMRIVPRDIGSGSWFGKSVDIDDNVMVVGAFSGGESMQGSVYVYRRNATTWTEEAKLAAPEIYDAIGFGYPLSVRGTTIAVGDWWHEVGYNGYAFVYEHISSSNSWYTEEVIYLNNDCVKPFGHIIRLTNDEGLFVSCWSLTNPTLYHYGKETLEGNLLKPVIEFHHPIQSIAVDGNTMVASEYGEGRSHVIHFFVQEENDVWEEVYRIDEPTFDETFGMQVTLHGNTTLIASSSNVYQVGDHFG